MGLFSILHFWSAVLTLQLCFRLLGGGEFRAAQEKKTAQIESQQAELQEVIDGLDDKLDRVLKKQEHDYLKGYSIYVKQKEKELKELINKLNEKNSNNTLKDEMIHNLKQTIGKLNTEQIKMEGEKQTQNERIRYLHARSQALE